MTFRDWLMEVDRRYSRGTNLLLVRCSYARLKKLHADGTSVTEAVRTIKAETK
jgi:hypothetical protein